MGSLMPGYEAKQVISKEEIEAYWRHKQQKMEALGNERHAQNANTLPSISETKLATTTTVAPDGRTTQKVVIEWPQPTASSPDWWTKSTWAYLNARTPEILDFPGQSRHRPYVQKHDVTTQYNRSISSTL